MAQICWIMRRKTKFISIKQIHGCVADNKSNEISRFNRLKFAKRHQIIIFFSFLFIFHSRKNRKIFVTQSQLILSCHINIAHLIYTLEYSDPRPAFANCCVFVCSSPIISSKATWYFFVSITKSKYVYRTLFSKQKTSNNEYLSHYYVMECGW